MKKAGNYNRYAWNIMKCISISIVLSALAGDGQATLQDQQDDEGWFFSSINILFSGIFLFLTCNISMFREIVAYTKNIFMNNKLSLCYYDKALKSIAEETERN